MRALGPVAGLLQVLSDGSAVRLRTADENGIRSSGGASILGWAAALLVAAVLLAAVSAAICPQLTCMHVHRMWDKVRERATALVAAARAAAGSRRLAYECVQPLEPHEDL